MEIYPVCKRLVGAPFFAAMAARYVSEHASTSPDLGDYGGELPAFLRAFTPMAPGVQRPGSERPRSGGPRPRGSGAVGAAGVSTAAGQCAAGIGLSGGPDLGRQPARCNGTRSDRSG
ncbi:DNA-binding domain-containing protein [Synechococcus sp. CS-1324]|nr:DNA-binding domain-containing protein [Synechococcus sp. CS-1324]